MSSIEKLMSKKKSADETHIRANNENSIERLINKPNVNENKKIDDKKSEHIHTANFVNIDLEKLSRQGYITPGSSNTNISDEYRVIKRPLLKNAINPSSGGVDINDNKNLIMVTSALPGEGKSFTSINLAMSIAMEMDHSVLLVEADVVRPSFSDHLGIPRNHKGLVDCLLDSTVGIKDIILKTNIEKLSILPSGPNSPRATELLASQNMRNLANELVSRYSDRIVIFDAPPILVSSEADVLVNLAGQIVMVVDSSATPQGAVLNSIERFSKQQIVGIVLNKCNEGTGNKYGYYGYTSE